MNPEINQLDEEIALLNQEIERQYVCVRKLTATRQKRIQFLENQDLGYPIPTALWNEQMIPHIDAEYRERMNQIILHQRKAHALHSQRDEILATKESATAPQRQ